MFDAPFAAQEPPADVETADLLVALAERRLRLLQELTEIGMKLARELGASEASANDKDQRRDPAAAFAPLSRAIRLTLTLEARTGEELRDLKAGVVRVREARRAAAVKDADQARDVRENRVEDLVMRVAESESETDEDFENFSAALDERLREDEACCGIGDMPTRDAVEQLCHDLGLHPDWTLWDGEGWIGEEPIRCRFSPFNTPSAKPFRKETIWSQNKPAPPPRHLGVQALE